MIESNDKDNNKVLVSVCIMAYNHEKYIAESLDSALMQHTNFPFEIILGEDESSDGTRDICIKYANKYSDKIKLFLRERKNVLYFNGRPTGRYNFLANLKEASGKYIALLDGDDYWTDPYKLQKQVDFFESHPDVAGCFHDVVSVDENRKVINENYYLSKKSLYNQYDCVISMGAAYATASLMSRSLVFKKLPQWFLKTVSDYTIDLLITEYGHLAHIKENMGAYRIHKGGIWQGNKPHQNLEQTVYRYSLCLQNPKFRKEYGWYFRKRISELSYWIVLAYTHERKAFKELQYAWRYFFYLDNKSISALKFFCSKLFFSSFFFLLKKRIEKKISTTIF